MQPNKKTPTKKPHLWGLLFFILSYLSPFLLFLNLVSIKEKIEYSDTENDDYQNGNPTPRNVS